MVCCRAARVQPGTRGIIQGMRGSPIYIDGKLLGAVIRWESEGPDRGESTPFEQRVAYRPVERPERGGGGEDVGQKQARSGHD